MSRHDEIKASYKQLGNIGTMYDGIITRSTLLGKLMDSLIWGLDKELAAKWIKGAVDKKLSANLEKLKEQGYPFQYKIFTELGHGGLAGEQPERFLEEMIKAHEGR